MNERHQPALAPPISFADLGAGATEADGLIASFAEALRLGASGLASDVWSTADGTPVLHHRATIASRLRRRSILSLSTDSLGPAVPTLAQLYSGLGGSFDLSVTLRDSALLGKVVELARAHMGSSTGAARPRLWLCHHDWEQLARWHSLHPGVSLVEITGLADMADGAERHAARLATAGIRAVSMPYPDWTAGLVVLFRRFGILGFGRDAPHERMLDDLLRMGIDAVYSSHVDRMTAAMSRAGWPAKES